MAIRKSIAVRNAQLDALSPLANDGYLRIYSGTMPATPDVAVNGLLLAELRFGAEAFNPAKEGAIIANPIRSDPSSKADGTATYFRIFQSDGKTAVLDGTVDTSLSDLVVPSTNFVAGIIIAISSLTVIQS